MTRNLPCPCPDLPPAPSTHSHIFQITSTSYVLLQFSVFEVEGDVEPKLPLSSIYRPPPPANLQQQEPPPEEQSGSVQGAQMGLAALLGCVLLGLMVMLP